MTKLTYDWVDDETAEVYLDDSFLYTMSHGPHGWDGMVGIQDALNSLAKLKGWEIVHKGDPAI